MADELYGLPPAEFTASRDERARLARAEGNKDLSDAIKKLRRPTASAALVNRLVREAGDQVDRLLELGESMREAQQAMAGDRLRSLSAQRRPAIQALALQARQLAAQAGRPVSDQVEREVEATLEAALADPGAAEAVRSGRLTAAPCLRRFWRRRRSRCRGCSLIARAADSAAERRCVAGSPCGAGRAGGAGQARACGRSRGAV